MKFAKWWCVLIFSYVKFCRKCAVFFAAVVYHFYDAYNQIFPKLIWGNSHNYFLLIINSGQNLFSKIPYNVTTIAVIQIKAGIIKIIHKIKHLIQTELKTLQNKQNNSINTI